jgi:uncharacterized protein (DUF433 family)
VIKKATVLGVGIYSRAEAARLLKVTQPRLRRSVLGYTYWLHLGERESLRKKPPVVSIDLPVIDDAVALSFVELMELRVVKAFIDNGIPLQRIRIAAELAMQHFDTKHPFASGRVFTDGKNIFKELAREAETSQVLELTKDRHLQIQSAILLKPFLDEISFSSETSLAQRWWPLSRAFPVVLDPKIAFGAPVIDGTAVRTEVVAGMAKASSKKSAAAAYLLSEKQVGAAVEFESLLAAA